MFKQTAFAFSFGVLATIASGQALYTFDDLVSGQPLAGQDGWVAGITGSGSPQVLQDGPTLVASGTFKSAARRSGNGFEFAEEFDTLAVRIEFDIDFQVSSGNIALGTQFYDDTNNDTVVNTGEEVVNFGITRNNVTTHTPHVYFIAGENILEDIAPNVSNNDRFSMRADIFPAGNGFANVKLYLLNLTRGDTDWSLIAENPMLPHNQGKSLVDVDALQIRFDSGTSSIDNISISRLPYTPTPCEIADTNADGTTNAADFTFWVGCFNLGLAFPGCETADQNGDGVLRPSDFTAWIANFNSCG